MATISDAQQIQEIDSRPTLWLEDIVSVPLLAKIRGPWRVPHVAASRTQKSAQFQDWPKSKKVLLGDLAHERT